MIHISLLYIVFIVPTLFNIIITFSFRDQDYQIIHVLNYIAGNKTIILVAIRMNKNRNKF